MAVQSSYSTGVGTGIQGVDMDNNRRIFNFGDRVAELAPQQSPFFVYLNKVAKKATNDPVFKFLEQRHQWQRRNFKIDASTTVSNINKAYGNAWGASNDLVISCFYDDTGSISSTAKACNFIIPGQVLAIKTSEGVKRVQISASAVVDSSQSAGASGYIVHEATKTTIAGENVIALETFSSTEDVEPSAEGQVLGSAWAEGTKAPDGWEDALFDREGYCQIFKTGMKLFSNTKRATEYRGIKNEYQRVWTEKLMEHKMDMEQAFLFGYGAASRAAGAAATVDSTTRYTWGMIPYTEANGKIYNFNYASSGYDAFLDAMEDFFAPESGNSGNKLVLASREVITYLNKLGNGGFMNNTIGTSQYRLDVTTIPGKFGHTVTMVDTIYGKLHFVADPLLRGPWEDYCVAVDMKNVAYRPLVGNGINRDTFIETNIQLAEEDGRRDQIITEAGLEISLPETHAILKFS